MLEVDANFEGAEGPDPLAEASESIPNFLSEGRKQRQIAFKVNKYSVCVKSNYSLKKLSKSCALEGL